MYKEGSFIQYKDGNRTPYRVHIVIGYAEFQDAMPDEQYHAGYNVYGFYDEQGRLVQAYEHQLELWTPHDDDEAWVSQFGPDTWLEYQFCKKAAKWLDGLPEDILMRRLAEKVEVQ